MTRYLIILLLPAATALFPQDTLEVVKVSGPSEMFLVDNISKITFTGTDMVVGGPNRTIPISTIAVLIFHPSPMGVETGTPTASLLFEPLSPNPFTPATSLKFGLVRSGRISVQIFDAGGKLVRSLFSGRKAAGNYALTWDGRDDAGRSVGSGVYHFQLIVNSKRTIKRAVLVR